MQPNDERKNERKKPFWKKNYIFFRKSMGIAAANVYLKAAANILLYSIFLLSILNNMNQKCIVRYYTFDDSIAIFLVYLISYCNFIWLNALL